MSQHPLIRNLLFAGLGLVAGFLALAVAVPLEPQLPAPLLAVLSPGLKIAELIMPDTHGSLAWTFGWFLRIAILGNGIFYYGVFAFLAYLLARRRRAVGS
ncbi:MAG TPA: hypothetical protein VF748_13450 [Candidatus Acidoferrum sp.]